jgi:hypothetical protein
VSFDKLPRRPFCFSSGDPFELKSAIAGAVILLVRLRDSSACIGTKFNSVRCCQGSHCRGDVKDPVCDLERKSAMRNPVILLVRFAAHRDYEVPASVQNSTRFDVANDPTGGET